MDISGLISSLQSGLIAGVFAVIATVLVEKLGGVIGGTITAIPFTFIPGSYSLITSAENSADWKASISSVAFSCFGDLVFIEMWKILPSKIPRTYNKYLRIAIISIISSLIWTGVCFFCTYIFFLIRDSENWIVPCGLFAWFVHLCLGIGFSWHALPSVKGRNHVSVLTYISRGLLAFITIGLGSLIAKTGNMLVASIFLFNFNSCCYTISSCIFNNNGFNVYITR